MIPVNLNLNYPSWEVSLKKAIAKLHPDYLNALLSSRDWLPGPDKIFNAFTLPLEQVNYVLFGESPYPREASANGFAFWDGAVTDIWSSTGLSKAANRATSLRNLIKMLLVAENKLDPLETSQEAIRDLDKSDLVQTNSAFFNNFLRQGFLLLNTTPVLQNGPPAVDAKAWLPFMRSILRDILDQRPNVTFILFGRIANQIENLIFDQNVVKLSAEHPYNVSFITNPTVIEFFRPLHLLKQASLPCLRKKGTVCKSI